MLKQYNRYLLPLRDWGAIVLFGSILGSAFGGAAAGAACGIAGFFIGGFMAISYMIDGYYNEND